MYEGMWKEDKRHGMGSEIIAADKSRFMGIYDRGRPGDCPLCPIFIYLCVSRFELVLKYMCASQIYYPFSTICH